MRKNPSSQVKHKKAIENSKTSKNKVMSFNVVFVLNASDSNAWNKHIKEDRINILKEFTAILKHEENKEDFIGIQSKLIRKKQKEEHLRVINLAQADQFGSLVQNMADLF